MSIFQSFWNSVNTLLDAPSPSTSPASSPDEPRRSNLNLRASSSSPLNAPSRISENSRAHSQPNSPASATTVDTPVTVGAPYDHPLPPRLIQGNILPDPGLSPKERLQLVETMLGEDTININTLRCISFHAGLPESGNYRSLVWKILLGYLPIKKQFWAEILAEKRATYQEWKRELRNSPIESTPHVGDLVVEELGDADSIDNPLSQSNNSEWNKFFLDNDKIFEIEKDVLRTFPHLHFFKASEEIDNPSPQQEREAALKNPHYSALRSILFIWSKLNPGIAYVQGMNEILGPIYYVFATDSDPSTRENAEADAFFCFTNLMSEIMNNFIKSLDDSALGIQGQMMTLNAYLRLKDSRLWEDLEHKGIHPQFYSFRWLTLLLSQEFQLPDVLRLWYLVKPRILNGVDYSTTLNLRLHLIFRDTLFADEHRFVHLIRVCAAMMISSLVRDSILESDFARTIKLLQSYPTVEIIEILELAKAVAHPEFRLHPELS